MDGNGNGKEERIKEIYKKGWGVTACLLASWVCVPGAGGMDAQRGGMRSEGEWFGCSPLLLLSL